MSETKTTVIPDPGEYKFILIIEEDGTEASVQHWIDNNAGGSIRRALSLGKAQAVSIEPLPWDPGGWPTRYTRSNVDLPIDWVDASQAFEVHITTDKPFKFTWDDHKAHVYGVSRVGNAVQNDSLFNAVNGIAYGADLSGVYMWVAVGVPFIGLPSASNPLRRNPSLLSQLLSSSAILGTILSILK